MKQPNSSTPQPKGAPSPSQAQEARCECGHLVAKLRKEGVELKCRRCKRIMILPFQSDDQDEVILEPCHSS